MDWGTPAEPTTMLALVVRKAAVKVIGKTLSHYEIRDSLGAGGMGEVYRARDATLDRDVAIKVLPEDLAADAARLARFEREAKLLASLNHANIGAIYGLEESGGVRFLVLELIEGETLEERIERGLIPVPEVLDIAGQMAKALEAAHDAGIVHRDVKPANVLLTPKGVVKVLDFGLAKNTGMGVSDRGGTQATNLTVAGTLMGTPPYMSPEQIRGEDSDKRIDIWAFGCVVYEMLTGERAFPRETLADTLVAVLETEPDWTALPMGAPGGIPALLRRCLRKDANRRLRDIGDARIEIEESMTPPSTGLGDTAPSLGGTADTGVTTSAPLHQAPAAPAGWKLVAPWAVSAMAVLGAITMASWPGSPAVDSPARTLEITLGSGNPGWMPIEMSPDGTQIAYWAWRVETPSAGACAIGTPRSRSPARGSRLSASSVSSECTCSRRSRTRASTTPPLLEIFIPSSSPFT